MRKIDSLGLKLCNFQAQLFEESLNKYECSSRIFVRRFMNSDLAKRMDNDGFLFESLTITDALDEIEQQYGTSTYGKEKYTVEEMHWIGYIYRYWSFSYGLTSRQIYKIAKPEQMRKLYFPYHSLDPRQAIDRIIEGTGMETTNEAYSISRGVEILRKIKNRNKI